MRRRRTSRVTKRNTGLAQREHQDLSANLTMNDWRVIALALETHERHMFERGALPAAEAVHNVRTKINLRRLGGLE